MTQAPIRNRAPNLPVPPQVYESRYFDQLLQTLRTYFMQVDQRDPVVQAFTTISTITDSTATLGLNDAGLVLADCTSNDVTVTLPPPADAMDYMFTVKRKSGGANTVTITTPSGTIDGSASVDILVQYVSLSFRSDGTNYWIV